MAGVRIVILTTFEIDEYVFEAIRAGASGFLVKDTEPVELLRAVRAVAAGDALLSPPGVTRRLIGAFATQTREAPPTPALDLLTDREREVMALVAEGLSNDEIAERLYVSPMTAKTHVSRAMMAGGPRPGPARGVRLRVGPGPPGLDRLTGGSGVARQLPHGHVERDGLGLGVDGGDAHVGPRSSSVWTQNCWPRRSARMRVDRQRGGRAG